MKITAFELGRLRVPLKTPFKTALRTVDAAESVVVRLHTDTGRTGLGEAAATAVITGETHGSIIAAISQHIAPRLIGQPVADLNRLCGQVQNAMARNSRAKAAVDIALHDLWAQLHGARCTSCWAAAYPNSPPTSPSAWMRWTPWWPMRVRRWRRATPR
ncbi:MAG: L-Ala-D/L-Glu epimerase [Stenotrophomonas maltophilia]|uniref:L-Ala-D/L-Glu epimerase n=1 Tax=Stenotrophomonas maltophilia TaxID=40324 RepID=A0A7V8FF76_STEMA|nr:MAG: L-Ala-D/L-Glu epimerase [Stenotrophomonas maltophilia]